MSANESTLGQRSTSGGIYSNEKQGQESTMFPGTIQVYFYQTTTDFKENTFCAISANAVDLKFLKERRLKVFQE